MNIKRNIDGNVVDLIIEVFPNCTDFYKMFDFINIYYNNIVIRTISFEEIILNEGNKCFNKIENIDGIIKYIKYVFNFKKYLGNNLYGLNDIFYVEVIFNHNFKVNIYYNYYIFVVNNTNQIFNLIPHNCYNFFKISSLILIGNHKDLKIFYNNNNEIAIYHWELKNYYTQIDIKKLKTVIKSINNLIKFESRNYIYFTINNLQNNKNDNKHIIYNFLDDKYFNY